MEWPLVLSIISLIFVALNFVKAQYLDKAADERRRTEEARELAKCKAADELSLERRFSRIESQVGSIETKVGLFWATVTPALAALLHSPHTPEADILIEKLSGNTINNEEIAELNSLLDDELVELRKPHFLKVLQPVDSGKIAVIILTKGALAYQKETNK